MGKGKIRVAIAGVGNCASAFVQGVYYYREKKDMVGLAHPEVGGYLPEDIEFVAAFDIDKRKIGKDLGEAIFNKPNNTPRFQEVPKTGVIVKKGPVHDGVGRYLREVISFSDEKEVDVVEELRSSKADILVNYLPVGSENGSRFYAQSALEAGVAFVNAMPTFIASSSEWQKKFEERGLPIAGDDVMSQLGATVLHKTLIKLLVDRGVKIDESYQLNIGGDTDFLNMLEQRRLISKRESKTSAVRAMTPYEIPLRIGPSDYVPFLENEKICYIWIKGRYFGGAPLSIDLKLSVVDSPNSAGIIIDALRGVKVALDRGISGPLISVSAYCFKHPPVQMPYEEAKRRFEEFARGERDR
ncbi:MAG: inositol-3-phosphate synthase [Thermoproteota archaeon]